MHFFRFECNFRSRILGEEKFGEYFLFVLN